MTHSKLPPRGASRLVDRSRAAAAARAREREACLRVLDECEALDLAQIDAQRRAHEEVCRIMRMHCRPTVVDVY